MFAITSDASCPWLKIEMSILVESRHCANISKPTLSDSSRAGIASMRIALGFVKVSASTCSMAACRSRFSTTVASCSAIWRVLPTTARCSSWLRTSRSRSRFEFTSAVINTASKVVISDAFSRYVSAMSLASSSSRANNR